MSAFATEAKLQPGYSSAQLSICAKSILVLFGQSVSCAIFVFGRSGICGIPKDAINFAPSAGVTNSPLASGCGITGVSEAASAGVIAADAGAPRTVPGAKLIVF